MKNVGFETTRDIERAVFMSAPPDELVEVDPWLVGIDGGGSLRSCSAAPAFFNNLASLEESLSDVIEVFRAAGKVPILRVPCTAEFERFRVRLLDRGYVPFNSVEVIAGKVEKLLPRRGRENADCRIRIEDFADADWCNAYVAMDKSVPVGLSRVASASRAQRGVFALASVYEPGPGVSRVPVSCGYGSYCSGWFSIHGLRTAFAHRGAGYAFNVVGALARHATTMGVDDVFLLSFPSSQAMKRVLLRLGFRVLWSHDYWRIG